MPSFKNCKAGDEECTQAEIIAFINRNVRYPELCKQNNITGRVFVEMVVDRKGKVTKVKLAPGSEGMAHEQLENEALRVVNKLPDFRPGRQQGRC